jgi:hypothetical protein
MTDRMIVRSYRRVFRVDRRIYRVDRWALPVPGGVPLRGLAYLALALLAVLVLGALPVVGGLLGAVSAPLRYLVVPLAVAVLLAQATPDGRPAHAFAADWLAMELRGRRRSLGRRVPREREAVRWSGSLTTRGDEHAPVLRHARIDGPASVTFGLPVELERDQRGRLVARAASEVAAGTTVELATGERLEVRR